jgi:hypothetical protein
MDDRRDMNEDDQDLVSLFGNLEPRPEPASDVQKRVFQAVAGEWRRHRRRRWRGPLALAAMLLIALAGTLLVTGQQAPIELEIARTGGLRVDDALIVGRGERVSVRPELVLTAEAVTRIMTPSGIDLRMRPGTRLRWLRTDAVALDGGEIYVETSGGGSLQVHTRLGVVEDIGTTFLVRIADESLQVAMRHGAAVVATAHGRVTARARDHRGDVVTVDARRLETRVEAASAERWHWIHAVHPGYTGQGVMALLEAIADDLGLPLAFSSPAVRASAAGMSLQGDISGLPPEQALKVLLATTGLARQPDAGAGIVVGFQSPDD